MPYEYHAKVTEVIDGDTVVIDIDLGFDVVFINQKVRLLGIDTPESRTSDKTEKAFGNVDFNRLASIAIAVLKQLAQPLQFKQYFAFSQLPMAKMHGRAISCLISYNHKHFRLLTIFFPICLIQKTNTGNPNLTSTYWKI